MRKRWGKGEGEKGRGKRGGEGKEGKEGEGTPKNLQVQDFPTSLSECWNRRHMSPRLVTGKLLTK